MSEGGTERVGVSGGDRRRLVAMCGDEVVLGWNLQSIGLSRALRRAGVPGVRGRRTGALWTLGRAVARAGLIRPLVQRTRLIAPLAWASDSTIFPYAYRAELVPWIFDCWGPQFPRWERLLRRHRVKTAFFSARDTAAHFRRAIPGLAVHWVPEAADLEVLYPGKPLAQRPNHVLELGRKWDWAHERLRDPLRLGGYRHLYSGPQRPAVPPGFDPLNRALGDTAISMCFPKTVTHPEAAGGVETVTQRYFEVLGSGCLAVGTCPAELRDLFGFDPVIPLSRDDPAGQVLAILDHLGDHQAHVDRCLTRVREVATFDLRARQILHILGHVPVEKRAGAMSPMAAEAAS